MFLPSGAAQFGTPFNFQYNHEYNLLPDLPNGSVSYSSLADYPSAEKPGYFPQKPVSSAAGAGPVKSTEHGSTPLSRTVQPPDEENRDLIENSTSASRAKKLKDDSKKTETVAPVKLACTECRLRHLKCDARSPSCKRCVQEGLDCCYIKSRRGYKGHRKDKDVLRLQQQQRQEQMKYEMAQQQTKLAATELMSNNQLPTPPASAGQIMSRTLSQAGAMVGTETSATIDAGEWISVNPLPRPLHAMPFLAEWFPLFHSSCNFVLTCSVSLSSGVDPLRQFSPPCPPTQATPKGLTGDHGGPVNFWAPDFEFQSSSSPFSSVSLCTVGARVWL